MKKIIFLLFVILFCSQIDAKVFTRAADSLELLKLYDSTGGSTWRHKSGWSDFSPVVNWYGVELDTIVNGSDSLCIVKKIALQANNLRGELPDLNLPNLESIYLPGNQLSGSIPGLNTPKLKTLYLTGNKLSGAIPLFNLQELEVLELSGNSLTGEIPAFNLPKLKILNLNNNELTGTIPNFNFTNFEKLYLENNKLTGNIPNFKYLKLVLINLQNNVLTGNIPDFNLPILTTLNLERNNLSGSIPGFKNTALSELNLSYNKLTGKVPDFNLPELRNLELQNNTLSDSVSLTKIVNIESIWLNNNKISGLQVLSNLKKLIRLKMQNNKITFEDIEPNVSILDFDYSNQDTLLPIMIERNSNTFTMTVVANGTSNHYQWQKDNVSLPGTDSNVYTGTELGLYKCIVTNSLAPNLTLYTKNTNPIKMIYALKSDSLELVKLFNNTNGAEWKRKENWLTDSLILNWRGVETDTIIQNQDSLLVVKSLKLGNNQLTGEMPVLNFPNIEFLDLFNNNLIGNIPVMDFPILKSIDLSNNSLSGNIPVISTPLIESFDISNNELTGNIPDFNFPNAEYINLGGNFFKGEIPNFTFPNADLLILSENELNGTIPEFDFPILTELKVNNNKLSGEFPMMNTPAIRSIVLDNNLLSGLPDMAEYESLEELSVKNNKLTFEDLENKGTIISFSYNEQDTILPIKVKFVKEKYELWVIANGTENKYQWQNNELDMYRENDDKTYVTESGNYRCKVTNSRATELTLYSETIDPTTIDVKDKNQNADFDIEVFPNPASDYIMIKVNSVLSDVTSYRISIYLINAKGDEVIVLKNSMAKVGENIIYFDTNFMSSGMYFLKVKSNGKSSSIPLVILK